MANRYYPIWHRLKTTGQVSLAIPVGLQPRVIKAVIRTKDEDVLFKFELNEVKQWAKVEYKIESSRVTFKLIKHIRTKNLALEDL